MNRTHSTNNFKGFTLIELLVVIAIIGLLSTIIAAPIQNARKKARDAKKIAETKGVQLGLDQYAEANAGAYPVSLQNLAPSYMPLIPGFAYATSTTVSPRDRFAYVPYEISGASFRTSNFGYHMGVHLENYSQALDNDSDCFGVETRAGLDIKTGTSTCAFYPAAAGGVLNAYYAGATFPVVANTYNFGAGMISPLQLLFANNIAAGAVNFQASGAGGSPAVAATSSSDFTGKDGNITTCDGVNDCVFDVTAQQ